MGAEDELTPVAESEAMAAMVPGSQFVVIPGAGHLSNFEWPDAFNAALSGFLNARCAAPCEATVASPDFRAPSPESCL